MAHIAKAHAPWREHSLVRNLFTFSRWPSVTEALADSFEACVDVQRRALEAHPDGGRPDVLVDRVVLLWTPSSAVIHGWQEGGPLFAQSWRISGACREVARSAKARSFEYW